MVNELECGAVEIIGLASKRNVAAGPVGLRGWHSNRSQNYEIGLPRVEG